MVVANGKAKAQRVNRVELPDGSWVVTNGLRATDRVLIAPPAELADGDPVESVND